MKGCDNMNLDRLPLNDLLDVYGGELLRNNFHSDDEFFNEWKKDPDKWEMLFSLRLYTLCRLESALSA